MPAILNKQDKKTIDQLSQFGKAIGKGFQVHDDLLEIYGDPKKMGKSLGSDIKEGKQTIMVIKARKKFPREWELIISNSKKDDNLSIFRNFFKKNGIKRETEHLAKQYFSSARHSIKNIKIPNINELNNFVDLIERRTF